MMRADDGEAGDGRWSLRWDGAATTQQSTSAPSPSSSPATADTGRPSKRPSILGTNRRRAHGAAVPRPGDLARSPVFVRFTYPADLKLGTVSGDTTTLLLRLWKETRPACGRSVRPGSTATTACTSRSVAARVTAWIIQTAAAFQCRTTFTTDRVTSTVDPG